MNILGISADGLDLYTVRNELEFDNFHHIDAIKNIFGRRDHSNDIFTLSFRSQLLPFRILIIHSIL